MCLEGGQDSQRGYAMAALLVSIGVMMLLMSVAMPVWRTQAQREKEAELIFRGEQIARGDQPLHAQDGWRQFPAEHRRPGPGPIPSKEIQGSDDGKRRVGSDPGRWRSARTGGPAATTAARPRPRWAIHWLERASFPNGPVSNGNGLDETPVAVFWSIPVAILRSTAVAVLRSKPVAILRRTSRFRWAARRRTHGGSQQEQGSLVPGVQRIRARITTSGSSSSATSATVPAYLVAKAHPDSPDDRGAWSAGRTWQAGTGPADVDLAAPVRAYFRRARGAGEAAEADTLTVI